MFGQSASLNSWEGTINIVVACSCNMLLKLFLAGQCFVLSTYDLTDGCILTHVKPSMTSHYYMKKGIIHFPLHLLIDLRK